MKMFRFILDFIHRLFNRDESVRKNANAYIIKYVLTDEFSIHEQKIKNPE